MLTLDHIAVSTTDLPTGTAEVEDALNLPLAPGGQHAAMGTWNRLLSLGPEEYFELIAIEPGAPGPAQPRWFDLDNFTGPTRPTTWICRCDDLDAALAHGPLGTGTPWSLERADLSWRMAIPAKRQTPFRRPLPSADRMGGHGSPRATLPDRDVRLKALELHSAPARTGFAQRCNHSSRMRASPSCPPTRPAWSSTSTRQTGNVTL
jgi:hypothetical protein